MTLKFLWLISELFPLNGKQVGIVMECDIASYHIESFNHLADEGINLAACDIPSVKLRLPNSDALEFSYVKARLEHPTAFSASELVCLHMLKTFENLERDISETHWGRSETA